MYWELLKRFPTLPPFGPDWFRSLRYARNLITQLRVEWMFLNMQRDEELEVKSKKEEIEYSGFFANPEFYFQFKDTQKKKDKPRVFKQFQIEKDTSDFDRRLELAMAGEVEIKEPNQAVAERVAQVRRQKEEQITKDPRIHTAPTDDDYKDGSDNERLTVEIGD